MTDVFDRALDALWQRAAPYPSPWLQPEPEPVRCMLHPAEWVDAQGCSACCRIGRERADQAEWTAQVGRRLASAPYGIATGRVWSWGTPDVYGVPGQPELLQIGEAL